MKPLVIGIGNSYRSDDGIGPYVINRIRELTASHQDSFELDTNRGDISTLIDQWQERPLVILVDCFYHPDFPCGHIHPLDGLADDIGELLPPTPGLSSSHGFSVAEAVSLGRILHRLPEQLIIYGINGKRFDAGETLSPGMESAASELAESIISQFGKPH